MTLRRAQGACCLNRGAVDHGVLEAPLEQDVLWIVAPPLGP